MSRKQMPSYYGKNAAQQAQRKYLHTRQPETKRAEIRSKATADVVTTCILLALNDRFGLGEERLRRVTERANAVAEQFYLQQRREGRDFARKALLCKLLPYWPPQAFLLPAVTPPKKKQDWVNLSQMRETANTCMKFYAAAVHDVMGYGEERIAALLDATEEEYRRFAEYAKDGDYYGYKVLARRLEKIMHAQVEVDDSEAGEPIFGASIN